MEGIGSSESSVLMGYNKYETVENLWLYKTGQKTREQTNSFLADRGNRLEPLARRTYIEYSGNDVMDILCENERFPFVRASLDGWNRAKKLILEIKCPKGVNHYRAVVEGWIKPEYYCQIQHQFLASDGEMAHYWSFDGRSGHQILVMPDLYFMGELLDREMIFWECVQTKKKPDPKWFEEFR